MTLKQEWVVCIDIPRLGYVCCCVCCYTKAGLCVLLCVLLYQGWAMCVVVCVVIPRLGYVCHCVCCYTKAGLCVLLYQGWVMFVVVYIKRVLKIRFKTLYSAENFNPNH